MKEKLHEYALIAEIVGASCIVISLIFVGFQIRLTARETAINTSVTRTSAYQNLTAQLLEINGFTINNPDLAEALVRMQCGEDVAFRQVSAITTLGISYIRHADMAYQMFREGLIDKERLDNASRILYENIRTTPLIRTMWEGVSPTMNAEFAGYIDEMSAGSGVNPLCRELTSQ